MCGGWRRVRSDGDGGPVDTPMGGGDGEDELMSIDELLMCG